MGARTTECTCSDTRRASDGSWIAVSRATNSSPPYRASRSSARSSDRIRRAHVTRTRSPAACPYSSLTALKSSMSRNRTARRRPARGGCTRILSSPSWNPARSGRPVIASWVAWSRRASRAWRPWVMSANWLTKCGAPPRSSVSRPRECRTQMMSPSGRTSRISTVTESTVPAATSARAARSVSSSAGCRIPLTPSRSSHSLVRPTMSHRARFTSRNAPSSSPGPCRWGPTRTSCASAAR